MGSGRNWTKAEINYLQDKWGVISVKSIAKNLNRTETAIMLKAKRIGLGGAYNTGNYLNAYEVSLIMGVDRHCVTDYWIAKCGLKAKRTAMIELKMWQIKIDDLLKWLKNNQDKFDSRRMELFGLGKEPDWLKKKRKADLMLPKKRFHKWTKAQDQQLISYYRHGKACKNIAETMDRSESAIKRRLERLRDKGLLYRKRRELVS
jgi:predicted transcriptional regulator